MKRPPRWARRPRKLVHVRTGDYVEGGTFACGAPDKGEPDDPSGTPKHLGCPGCMAYLFDLVEADDERFERHNDLVRRMNAIQNLANPTLPYRDTVLDAVVTLPPKVRP